jgi:hypothetical protein
MTTIAEDLKRALRNLTIATVVVYLVLIGAGIFVAVQRSHDLARVEQVSKDTNTALCALRHDLELRVASSQQFLEEHPNGISGITPQTIQQSIDNQMSTIDALSNLDCG